MLFRSDVLGAQDTNPLLSIALYVSSPFPLLTIPSCMSSVEVTANLLCARVTHHFPRSPSVFGPYEMENVHPQSSTHTFITTMSKSPAQRPHRASIFMPSSYQTVSKNPAQLALTLKFTVPLRPFFSMGKPILFRLHED